LALVVDDSADDRIAAARIIERVTDLQVAFAGSSSEALEAVRNEAPAVILTGVGLPGAGQLVERLAANHPGIPIILLTSGGTEEAAASALRCAAASFIPKRRLRQELPSVLGQILTVARTDRRRYELMSCTARLDCEFELESDPSLAPVLVNYLQEYAERMGLCDRNGRIRLGVALEEALLNGVYHGNLEVSSDLKVDGDEAFHHLASRRRREEPYCQRRLHVRVQMDPARARFIIRDDGPGFDLSKIPDPTDPENLLRPSGRGLLLIRMFMDEVFHNAAGNEVTLVKRRTAEQG
jgi:CheY-like chemotaxis protein